MVVVVDQRAEAEQLTSGLRREPTANVGGGTFGGRLADAGVNRPQLLFQHERVVRARLDVHEQAVEGRNVDARRVEPALERLYECRPRACERIEHVLSGPEVPPQQDLDELRDELAEIRVQPVDVLRPLPLGQVALGPGEREIDVGVEGFLRRGHSRQFDAELRKPGPPAPIGRHGTP